MDATVAALMFPGLFLLIFLGIPIAFALTIVSVFAGWFAFGPMVFQQLYGSVFSAASHYVLSSIPLFVLMGAILEKSGIARNLFDAIQIWIGRLPGGLALTTIAMAAIFAAASGVVGAVEIMIGLMAIPAMRAYKYNNTLITGTICAGGSLGTIIPPTVIVVVYAALAQLSIGALFAAIIVPGLLMLSLFALYIVGRCLLRPQDGPAAVASGDDLPLSEKIGITLKALIPPLLLMFAVLGSLLGGIASPTEAAAVGVAGAVVLAAINGGISFGAMVESFSLTVRITAMILLIVAGGTMFTGIFAVNGGGDMVADIAAGLGGGTTGVILFFLGVTFLLGFVLDWTSIVLICVPIFTPIVKQMGIDPIWFATLVLVTIQTSYLTPPMASSIFYLKSIAPKDITYGQMCRGVLPFIAVQLLTLLLVALFPATATWLPDRIVGF
ncbi:TRAP transporter large permease [Halomonas elongata]|uniref:TRAP transporter large permease protein n=1 Tax=Halomonas elongata (strain ATCC 33173 / DSM 2581 / NBRC 15536 / NCIMB 2198 / 1H9) TaxID=768066 RepID=E1V793_HALED|nr:TRAP transporter large permease subunit [Halomonas elongata]MDL4862166.1 TRAP transporter large permease subunit [Halomonas elongata]RAW07502.1 C4-dicarboxylate ABC transporter permease [Halomonas elongata]WBF18677.1 TRAP transporter large permease subunit [Halomonas elongata]WPU47532.1 TRAP transporter large permease subunit [Halomonas elongata DSM 2581]CBV41443.1 TRAP transporter large transmembrane protein [Halomonas elongata DSM 2581]